MMLHFCAESAVKLQPTLPGWLLQCHLVLQQGKWGGGCSPPRPLLAIPNVTADPSTASVPFTVLLYSGGIRCTVILMCPLYLTKNCNVRYKSSNSAVVNTSYHKCYYVASYISSGN